MLIFLVIFGIISLLLFLWQLSNLISVFSGSPYVMMDKKVIRQALKSAGLKKGDVFYDLGCGNGQVVIEAAKLGAIARGFEISPYYYILAKSRIFIYKYYHSIKKFRWSANNLQIKINFQNINNVNLSKADVVYCYLLPKMLEKLSPKFKGELKPGSRLISIGFPIIHARACKMRKYATDGRTVFIYKF